MTFSMQQNVLFDFHENADISNWYVVDDGVMGGKSAGTFCLGAHGHGVYSGKVSLENNGGFSSVRHRFDRTSVSAFSMFVLRIKGDGKAYQFRVKTASGDYYSYIGKFSTKGDWETIKIPFATMYPAFRGRTLDQPNFPGKEFQEIAFLIGNKKAEDFQLIIDTIALQ